MDPVSLIGLIAASAQLLQICGSIAKRCHTACGQFKEASRTLNAIATECRTFEAAIATIQEWIDTTLRNSRQKDKLVKPLSSALEGFMSSLSELEQEVAKFGGYESPSTRLGRARYVWNEALMKDHLSEIRAQATALHLLLTACQLPIKDADSNIQKAADDARTIYRLRRIRRERKNFHPDANSMWTYEESLLSLLDKEFMFDDEIVNSMAYKRVMASVLARRLPDNSESKHDRGFDDIEKNDSDMDVEHHFTLRPKHEAERDPKPNVIDSMKLIPRDEQGFPLIVKAAIEGLDTQVAELLENGAHCEAIVLETGRTSLMEAAYGGYIGIVKLLLTHKCRLSPVDSSVMTALLLAVKQGHTKVVKALMVGGASTFERDSQGRAPLHLAAQYGHIEIVRILTFSESENDAPTFNLLADSINAIDLFHKTPLHFAAKNGHVAVVKHLKELGARLCLTDRGGRTAMHWAIIGGHKNVIDLLWPSLATNSKEKSEALVVAIRWNQLDIANQLSVKGCKINSEARALYTAIEIRSVAMVRFVLLNGGNINGCTTYCRDTDAKTWIFTPLSTACALEHTEIVKLLLEKGVKPNRTTGRDHRRSALHVSAATGNIEITKLLVGSKASLESTNEFNQRPLDEAAARGHLETVMLLLRYGAKILSTKRIGSFRSPNKDEPLCLAAAGGHTEMVKLLLDEGAALEDTSNLTCNGTALRTACYHGQIATSRFLLERGAKVAVIFDESYDQLQQLMVQHRSSSDPPVTLHFHTTVSEESKWQVWSYIRVALIKEFPFI